MKMDIFKFIGSCECTHPKHRLELTCLFFDNLPAPCYQPSAELNTWRSQNSGL